jgi:hypothetical protein
MVVQILSQENNIGMKPIVTETMNSYTDANKSILFLLGDDTENLKVCTTH